MRTVSEPTHDRDNAPEVRDVVTTFDARPVNLEKVAAAMKRPCALALLLAMFAAGCQAAGDPFDPGSLESPTPPVTTQPDSTPTARADGAADCRLPDGERNGLLAAVNVKRYADYDRVVFQFDQPQAPNAYIQYVDRVTEDPSDRPVPLLGKAFVNIAFHGARLDTSPVESDPRKARRYTGPTRLTPRYPDLQELAVSGDFEAVLSFGLGLSKVARLSESIPVNLGCLILDVWRTPPDTLLWPMTSVAQAQVVQRAAEEGHQPWTLNAEQVVASYVRDVLRWPEATVKRLDEHVFQADATTRLAIITVTQPLGRPGTVWAVAGVVRSKI